MKKIIAIFFCFALVSAVSFAEVTLKPFLGFSNYSGKFSYTVSGFGYSVTTSGTFSWTPFTMGLDVGYIKENGFTFMFNNNLLMGGNVKLGF